MIEIDVRNINNILLENYIELEKWKNDKFILKELNEILRSIEESQKTGDIIIISGIKELKESSKVIALVDTIFNRKVYTPSRIEINDIFHVEPFLGYSQLTLSETSKVGGFHSDFWSVDYPPNFILLQCIAEDPRHPFYGRNQYAMFSKIRQVVQDNFNESEIKEFNNLIFYYKTNNKSYKLFDNDIVRYHEYLASDELSVSGLSWVNIIRDISLSVCEDFVLDKESIVIINNKLGLHRRGECTISFTKDKDYKSRKLSTIRFS